MPMKQVFLLPHLIYVSIEGYEGVHFPVAFLVVIGVDRNW